MTPDRRAVTPDKPVRASARHTALVHPRPGEPATSRDVRGWARVLGLSIAGAIAAIAIAGRVHAEVGPFDTTLTARPSLSGATTLHLAPFGTIELDTHDAPFDIALRVDELQIEEAQRIARNPAVLDSLEDELVADSRRALRRLAVRILLAALVGGLAGAMVATLRWRVEWPGRLSTSGR